MRSSLGFLIEQMTIGRHHLKNQTLVKRRLLRLYDRMPAIGIKTVKDKLEDAVTIAAAAKDK